MKLKDECRIINFTEHGDERGKLVALESLNEIPFEIKRIFYIYESSSDAIRGKHANRKSNFVFIAVKGTCKIRLYDESEELIIELNNPHEGLYIPKMIWKDMFDFSTDCVLLVLSNEYYDENEYIR